MAAALPHADGLNCGNTMVGRGSVSVLCPLPAAIGDTFPFVASQLLRAGCPRMAGADAPCLTGGADFKWDPFL